MSLSDDDLELVRAYSSAYVAAGGEQLPRRAEDVCAILREYDALTVPEAESAGRERALEENESDPYA